MHTLSATFFEYHQNQDIRHKTIIGDTLEACVNHVAQEFKVGEHRYASSVLFTFNDPIDSIPARSTVRLYATIDRLGVRRVTAEWVARADPIDRP